MTGSFLCFPAMKNNADKKFSYQQLPVTLKLIYTILQVGRNALKCLIG